MLLLHKLKSLTYGVMIMLMGIAISFLLIYTLTLYKDKTIKQETLMQLTFASWQPEQTKVTKTPESPPVKKILKPVKPKKIVKKKPVIKKPSVKKIAQQKIIEKPSIIEKPKPAEPIKKQTELTPIISQEKANEPVATRELPSTEKVEKIDQPVEPPLPIPTPVFQLTHMPKFLHKRHPEYPVNLKNRGLEGTVKLQLLIDETGKVREITVLHSAGEGFDQAAMRAMYDSTFIPAKVDQKSVAVLLTMPVKFKLM